MFRSKLWTIYYGRDATSVRPYKSIVDFSIRRKRSCTFQAIHHLFQWDGGARKISLIRSSLLLEQTYASLRFVQSHQSRNSRRIIARAVPFTDALLYHTFPLRNQSYQQTALSLFHLPIQRDLLIYLQSSLFWFESTRPFRCLSPSSLFLHQMHGSLSYQKRWSSSGTNNNTDKKSNMADNASSTAPTDRVPVSDAISEAGESSSSSSGSPTRAKIASEAVSKATHELEIRIKRVVGDLTVGDQISVAFIAVFTSILLLAPYAVRHMKQSADTYGYDDRLQTDDPVDEFAKLARREWGLGPDNVDTDSEMSLEKTESGQNQKFIELLLKDVLQSATVQRAAQEFVVQIIQSERFKETISRFVKELWSDLVTDPETVAQVIKLLEIAIQSEPIKNAVIELVLQIAIRETEFRAAMIGMIEGLGQDDAVRNAVVRLLIDAAHTTLNDPDILDHSMEFATDVVGDDIVQQTAGEALRKSVEHAVRPATTVLLTACGVGFLIFSVIALGYSRSTESEAVIFESAARSLQSNAATGILRIATWPFRVVQNGALHTTSYLWEWILSVLPELPDIPEVWHKTSAAGYLALTSLAAEAIALPWRCLKSSAVWVSSNCVILLRQMSTLIGHEIVTAFSFLGSLIASAFVSVSKSLKRGAISLAEHSWHFTVIGAQKLGSWCVSAVVAVSSFAKAGVMHVMAAFQSYWQRISSTELLHPPE